MGETSSEIRDEIEQQRGELGEHLQGVESHAREAMDWRAQFNERPMTMIGLAFGGGLLASTLMGGGGSSQRQQKDEGASSGGQARGVSSSPEGREMAETVDNIRGALVGLAARELRSFLSTALPGFDEEYRQSTERRGASEETRLDRSPEDPISERSQ